MWLFQKLTSHFTKNKENHEEKPVAVAEPERKRKRDADELDEKYARKRQRVEDKTEEIYTVQDRFEENSDLSENDEFFEVDNIAEFLSSRDKVLLRQDPFNLNFAATWTNEFTLLKDSSEFNKWRNCTNSHDGVFPREIYSLIASYCEPVTLFTLRHVSKPMNALVVQSDYLWRKHFYSRHWKLREDLENGFCGVDPFNEDKSEWVNVIPDNEVDWFGEYRRNHINSYFIRTLIGEITSKLQKIVDEYGIVKSEVKDSGQQALFFEPGLTNEEIDKQNRPDLPITNDLRELLRCCTGRRFSLKDKRKDYDLPPNISIGSYCGKGITYARAERGGYDDDETEDLMYHDPYPPCDTLKQRYERPKNELESLDMASDGDDYEPSQSSYDSEEEQRMALEELNENDNSKIAEDGVFGHHRHMPMIANGSMYDTDSDEEQYYDTNTASLIINSTSYGWSECVTCPSIVDYLQDISDCLDSPLIPFWLKLDDYALVKWDQADDDFVDNVESAEFGLGLSHWADLVQEVGQDYKTDLYYVPRAVKLLAAAAQDTIIKVFQRAQELETSDELQLSTFQRAAKEVSSDTYVLKPPERSWRRH